MDLIEDMGPVLGLIAFAGFAISVLFLFSQARELRRLRDWAGRSPERAAAAEARQAERLAEVPRTERSESTRGLRFDPLLLGAGAATALLALGIFTDAFGLLSDGDAEGGGGKRAKKERKGGGGGGSRLEVAVLNGTSLPDGTPGVPGLASQVAQDVQGSGFKPGEVADVPSSFIESVVMYQPGAEDDAAEVADAIGQSFGAVISTAVMTAEVEALAGSASVALIVGRDAPGVAEGTAPVP